jgi:hypothetical protein
VTGSGTQRDPYVLPWSLIESAQETYNPRLGKLRIPQRLAVFDGTYVRISGYIAFPITTSDPKEMLVMLNQWGGSSRVDLQACKLGTGRRFTTS